MTSLADKILKRVRAKKRDGRVWIPRDFFDLAERGVVNQALSRLAKSGNLRRLGHGFYDMPGRSESQQCPTPVNIDSAIEALARRDGVRIMPDGINFAHKLGLTEEVPTELVYVTDGPTRKVEIGERTIHLRHAGPKVMSWAGRPSAHVMLALRWLGPHAAAAPHVERTLKRLLPDRIKNDLARNSQTLPDWAGSMVHSIAAPDAENQ